jgi:hypothetical protein
MGSHDQTVNKAERVSDISAWPAKCGGALSARVLTADGSAPGIADKPADSLDFRILFTADALPVSAAVDQYRTLF